MHQLFFYFLLILLPTQLGYHFWPDWALVLGRRVDYLSPTLFLTDILIVLLLVSWFVQSFVGIKNLRITKPWYSFIIHNCPFIILCPFILANIWFAADRTVAIWTWIKVFEFFLLGWYVVKTKPDLTRVIFFLSISVLYSSLIAIAQFVLQHSVGGILWFLGERTFTAATPGIAQIPLCLPGAVSCPLTLRPYATFPHSNVLGGFLAVVLPLVFVQLFNRKQYWLRSFFIATFILGLVALVLTFSRSAWVIGVLGIGSMYFVLGRPRKFIPIGVTLLAACLMLLITVSIHSDSESVVVRQQLAVSAIKIWQTAPFTGVGLGNFLVALPRFIPSRTIYFLQPVHNIYLLLLSEAGIIGLMLLCWIIWKVIRRGSRQKNNAARITYYISLVALLALGLIDHYPFSLQQGRLLLTLFIVLSIA